jgi:triacylglycerol lipase
VSAELDLPEVATQTEMLRAALCDAGRCPTVACIDGHNHLSLIYAIGTVDTSTADAIQAFLRNLP